MARFRLDKVAELARQMAFTPREGRSSQVAAAEELLLELIPTKAYPFGFIVFRITGYHPRELDQSLLTGLALQHDLGLLVEHVSETLDVQVASLTEPVMTIDQVSEKFNVTSKTIQRWRRRGLAARRFIFPDGKKRVGFLTISVERFLASHRDQGAGAANYSQVDEAERLEILRHAMRLASSGGCCGQEIARRIGRKLNRSPITISHVIATHDSENPTTAILSHATRELSDDQRTQITRGYRRGASIQSIARRIDRSMSAVYRVVIDERLARLCRRKVKFIDDPLYHQDDARASVDAIAAAEDLMSEQRADESRIPRDLPPYLQALYRTPLLTPARERALFLKLNFHKFEFVTLRRKIEPQFVRAREVNLLQSHRDRAIEVKNQIVAANLRLVVSVARKHLRPGLSLMELISDGNMTLIRAVDSFDFHKGNRFSTYATLALMKGFARGVPEMMTRGRGTGGDSLLLAEVADVRDVGVNRMADRDQVHQLLAALEPRERDILWAHYGLADDRGPSTYEQVGARLGLSKQRVRQIEQIAIAKLRARSRLSPRKRFPIELHLSPPLVGRVLDTVRRCGIMKLTFVEASWFTVRWKIRMGDDAFRAMQNVIAEHPDKGKVMPGCGGLRKLRFADPGRGKGTRGGLHIIYLHIPEATRVDFFDVYDKDEKDDLTPREKKVLAELAKKARLEAVAAYRRSGGTP